MINIRQKGAEGEREVYRALNPIVQEVMRELGYPDHVVSSAANAIQRNQNQSAVGGNDLSNTFGLSIEVKRQEQLAVNTWWQQCVEAANRNGEVPVLLYRQNGKKWQCMTTVCVNLPGGKQLVMEKALLDWPSFLAWFKEWVRAALMQGQNVRT